MAEGTSKRTQQQFNRVQGMFERTKTWRTNCDTLLIALKSWHDAEETYCRSMAKISRTLKQSQKVSHGIDAKSLGCAVESSEIKWTLEDAWNSLATFLDQETENRLAFTKKMEEKVLKNLLNHSRDVNTRMKYLTTKTQSIFDVVGAKKDEMQEAYKQRKKAVQESVKSEVMTVDPWLYDIQYYAAYEELAKAESQMGIGMRDLQKEVDTAESLHVHQCSDCFTHTFTALKELNLSQRKSLESFSKGVVTINAESDIQTVRHAYNLDDLKIWEFDHSHVPEAKDHRESSVIISGKLHRLGSLFGFVWKTEYFELSPTGFLYSFEKPMELKPILAINLANCSTKKSGSYSAGFEVTDNRATSFLTSSGTCHTLCAENEEDMLVWLNHISKFTEGAPREHQEFEDPPIADVLDASKVVAATNAALNSGTPATTVAAAANTAAAASASQTTANTAQSITAAAATTDTNISSSSMAPLTTAPTAPPIAVTTSQPDTPIPTSTGSAQKS